MGNWKGRNSAPTEVLEAFVLRARRIVEHSLLRDHRELMQSLYMGTIQVGVTLNTTTGEASHVMQQEFPPEETMESLAARIRPLLLERELVYFEKVLDAIEAVVPAERLALPVSWWRDRWTQMVDRSETAEPQAYMIVTERGSVTDRQLMYAWYYGDLVHADDIEEKSRGLSIEYRYRAAANGVARIGAVVEQTLLFVHTLTKAGLVELDDDVFERAVIVSDPNVNHEATSYLAGLGAALPDNLADLDPAVWSQLHEVMRPDKPGESQQQ